jgi:hypothetical protein
MQAVRVTAKTGGQFKIEPLPLPTIQRRGDVGADNYRRLSLGGSTKSFTPLPADFLRTIVLADGKFNGLGLAVRPGPILTAVMAGNVTVVAGPSEKVELRTGDLLLTDSKSSSSVILDARDSARLLQLGVSSDFPGPDAQIQPPGTFTARPGSQPNLKRIYRGKGGESSFFADFSEVYPSTPNTWSQPYAVKGFRMMYWDAGEMDYHPCVINQIGVFLSGEHRTDVRGGGGSTESLRAGDICMSEDTTGEGHLNRVQDGMHAIVIVMGENNYWPLAS